MLAAIALLVASGGRGVAPVSKTTCRAIRLRPARNQSEKFPRRLRQRRSIGIAAVIIRMARRNQPCTPLGWTITALRSGAGHHRFAGCAQELLWPLRGEENPFLLFLAGVMFSSWLGGIGPGLLATALGRAVVRPVLHHARDRCCTTIRLKKTFRWDCSSWRGRPSVGARLRSGKSLVRSQAGRPEQGRFLGDAGSRIAKSPGSDPLRTRGRRARGGRRTPPSNSVRTVMERQLQQLTRLVDDLLDLSRIRSGKTHLHLQRAELADVVHDAVQVSRPLIEQPVTR